MITIHNKITPAKISYDFCGKNEPEFRCQINGKPIFSYRAKEKLVTTSHNSLAVPVENDEVIIRYDYNFGLGYKGAKEITFTVPNNTKEYELEFSWKNQSRVTLSQAKPKSVKRLSYNLK